MLHAIADIHTSLALIVTLIVQIIILCVILYAFASFSLSYTFMAVRNFIHLDDNYNVTTLLEQ